MDILLLSQDPENSIRRFSVGSLLLNERSHFLRVKGIGASPARSEQGIPILKRQGWKRRACSFLTAPLHQGERGRPGTTSASSPSCWGAVRNEQCRRPIPVPLLRSTAHHRSF